MKKIALLALMSLSLLKPFNAQSQTKEETVDWLKSKIGMLHGSYQKWYNLRTINGKVYLTYVQGLYSNTAEKANGATRIDFSKITSITYKEYADAFGLTLNGKFDAHDNGSNYGFEKSYDLDDIERTYGTISSERFIKDGASQIQIAYYTDLIEMKRIIKAYEWLAYSCGAKLVKDDLFKN